MKIISVPLSSRIYCIFCVIKDATRGIVGAEATLFLCEHCFERLQAVLKGELP